MTNDAALHSALERFFGITDLGHRQFLILLLRGQRRLDAETETQSSRILEEIRKMSETLQQQHDNILATVTAQNATLATVATQVPVIAKTLADLEAWFAKNSGNSNLIDFSDVEAALATGAAALGTVSSVVQNSASSPDPGPVPDASTDGQPTS